MIYVFQGYNNTASVLYSVLGLKQVQIDKAIQLESLPENIYTKGILKADKSQGLVWWEEAPASKILTKYQFRQRMTIQEKAKLEMLDSLLEGETLAMVKAVLKDFDLAEEINLLDENIVGFKQIMLQSNLFTQERIDEICKVE